MDPDVSQAEIELVSKLEPSALRGDCMMLTVVYNYGEIPESWERAGKALQQMAEAFNTAMASFSDGLLRLSECMANYASEFYGAYAVATVDASPTGTWQPLPLRKLREIGQWVVESAREVWHKDRPVFVLLCVWLGLLLAMFIAVAVRQIIGTW